MAIKAAWLKIKNNNLKILLISKIPASDMPQALLIITKLHNAHIYDDNYL